MPFLVTVGVVVALLAGAALAGWRAIRALHMLQLDSYLNLRYLGWVARKPGQRLFGWRPLSKKDAKKPLVYTSRARRILAVSWALLLAAAAAGAYSIPRAGAATALWTALAFVVLAHAAPPAVVLANLLLVPVQKSVNRWYYRKARAKLRRINPAVIGVAGSYGKTSTKFFIEAILREKFEVLKSPASYNTLLGICRAINETLEERHQVFVVEMGAYRRGEVRDTARLVSPRIGIVTSIGPEHFERFKSLDNIQQTNFELIEELPREGLALFNCDSEHCRELALWPQRARTGRYALTGVTADTDIWAEDVRQGPHGLSFTVVLKDGARMAMRTVLLGRLNVLNILGAVLVARELGMGLEEIAAAVGKLEPAPHRLQMSRTQAGVTILDDSYNSNPAGAAEAFRVLSEFQGGQRVLVTPGLVELGALQEQENEKFGRLAARAADCVILVGPEQTRPVARGLKAEGFPPEHTHVVKSLAEATALLGRLLRPGDTVLFENDLPDLYTER